MLIASFPSPSSGVVELGPLPLRAYAFCIVLGIIVSVVLAEQRLRARGAPEGTAIEIATWGVPFGLIGSRIYHVITTPGPYFGQDGDPLAAFEIWNGGLGIWGGIAGGFLGGIIALRRLKLPVLLCADAVAPPIVVAQAVGRWGNYFNQELYGRATDLPWAVEIAPENQIEPGRSTYHPTFLYESLWCLGVAVVCVWADRRFKLGMGRVFALYVALYCVGRAWIEALRIDEAHRFFGLRLNDYVSLALGLAAVVYLVARRGQREPEAAGAHGDVVPPVLAADATTQPTAEPGVEPEARPAGEEDEPEATSSATGDTRSRGKP